MRELLFDIGAGLMLVVPLAVWLKPPWYGMWAIAYGAALLVKASRS